MVNVEFPLYARRLPVDIELCSYGQILSKASARALEGKGLTFVKSEPIVMLGPHERVPFTEYTPQRPFDDRKLMVPGVGPGKG